MLFDNKHDILLTGESILPPVVVGPAQEHTLPINLLTRGPGTLTIYLATWQKGTS